MGKQELCIESLQFIKMKSFLLLGLLVLAFAAAANPIGPVADKETGKVENLMEPREKTFVKPSGLQTMGKDADVGESARQKHHLLKSPRGNKEKINDIKAAQHKAAEETRLKKMISRFHSPRQRRCSRDSCLIDCCDEGGCCKKYLWCAWAMRNC